jgi:hypothetical protein
MFANVYDIHRYQQRFNAATGLPNLGKAADNLAALAEWTNDNSDGWAYWPKPSRAGQRLMALLSDAERRERDSWSTGRMDDITADDLKAALTPVKAFLTRQGVAHTDVLL